MIKYFLNSVWYGMISSYSPLLESMGAARDKALIRSSSQGDLEGEIASVQELKRTNSGRTNRSYGEARQKNQFR